MLSVSLVGVAFYTLGLVPTLVTRNLWLNREFPRERPISNPLQKQVGGFWCGVVTLVANKLKRQWLIGTCVVNSINVCWNSSHYFLGTGLLNYSIRESVDSLCRVRVKRDVGMACQKVHEQGRIKVTVNIQSPIPTCTSLLFWERCRDG